MARITAAAAGGENVVHFLDLIAFSEGTAADPDTLDDGYDIIVNGKPGSPKRFSDYSKHPHALVHVNDHLDSTAAGRYQELARFADAYMKQLNLPDFGPVSQDKIAIQQIRERKALDDVKAGRIADAIAKCANIWASFPGNGYGQGGHSADTLVKQFVALGGKLAS